MTIRARLALLGLVPLVAMGLFVAASPASAAPAVPPLRRRSRGVIAR